jgi:methanethiol S-methyltransferase
MASIIVPAIMLAVGPSSRGALVVAWSGAVVFVISLGYFLYAYLVRFGGPAPSSGTARAVTWNVLLFSLFALHHSVMARSGVKACVGRTIDPALERSAYTWMASVLFLLVCGAWQPVPGDLYRLDGAAAVFGYAVQGAGVLLTIRASSRLDVLELAGVRQVLQARGGGPPPAPRLETRGLHGFVRHPLYFAWVLVVFGSPHMTMTRFVFATVSTVYLALAIPLEERSLLRAFGAEYQAYRTQVRWRMIPLLY